jgi:hypothetical protein
MHFLRYSVVPAAEHPERERLGEGLVLCWIERPSLAEADKAARRELQEQKWKVLAREDATAVTEADAGGDEEWLRCSRQALRDGEVFVSHLSPRYPVYWVIAGVREDSTSETAEAHYFLAGESIRHEGEDLYDPTFWTGECERTALQGAREAIAEGGWTVTGILQQGPCGRGNVPDELLLYEDEAKEAGACLVFVHAGEEPEAPEEPPRRSR